jgi:hypothetical protein
MVWLVVAVFSGVVAGVGFWRGTPSGIAHETMPGVAGVLFGLLMYRALSLAKDAKAREALSTQGGWPLRAAGAASLTAALAGAIDVGVWLQTKRAAFGGYALPLCTLAFVLLMITALRLSLNSPRRTHFLALAMASAVNAFGSAWLFVSLQLPGLTAR